MSTTVPQRIFTVPLSSTKGINVNIAEPDLRADNLTLTTWTSSFILANQLHKLKIHFPKDGTTIPILELGAGTGLVGLTAAIVWQQNTILTDLPGIVLGLRTNVDLNLSTITNRSTDTHQNTHPTIQCGSLDWTSPKLLALETSEQHHVSDTKAQVILAADTIYDEAHPELLSNAILTWLDHSADARAILCYPLRVAYLDHIREIWALLEKGGLEAEVEGQEEADNKDWDDECLCEWVVWKWKDS